MAGDENAYGFANSAALMSGGAAFSLATGVHAILQEGRAARARAARARNFAAVCNQNQALIDRLAAIARKAIDERDAAVARAHAMARENEASRAMLAQATNRLKSLVRE